MKWHKLTSPKLGKMDRSTPVVLNIGAIEQHGPHLPLETDALIGQYFTDRMEQDLGDKVLILPQIAVCCSEHHMSFPGSLTVRHETLLSYVSDVLQSVVSHGFRNVILFNSHGGNLAIGQVIMEKLGHRHPDVNFFMLTWWKVAGPQLKEIQESNFGGVGHACEFETSMLMYFAPELIDKDQIKDTKLQTVHEWADADMLVAGKASHQRSMAELTAGTGVFGSPSYATREKGQKIVDCVTEELVKILTDIYQK
ncbi:creatininase family protein [Paremcibacter congregatus]|uniref:creatininase family protein n=1 Tax=Paremcibacter congregatus TaxID=2043170 RepID=UPI003A8E4B34